MYTLEACSTSHSRTERRFDLRRATRASGHSDRLCSL